MPPWLLGPVLLCCFFSASSAFFCGETAFRGWDGNGEAMRGRWGSAWVQADTFLRSLAKRFCRASSSSVSPGGSVNMAGNGGSRRGL